MKSRFYEEEETGCLSSAAFTESAKNDLHENRNPKSTSVTWQPEASLLRSIQGTIDTVVSAKFRRQLGPTATSNCRMCRTLHHKILKWSICFRHYSDSDSVHFIHYISKQLQDQAIHSTPLRARWRNISKKERAWLKLGKILKGRELESRSASAATAAQTPSSDTVAAFIINYGGKTIILQTPYRLLVSAKHVT